MGYYIHPILSLRSRHQLDQSTEIAWVLLEHLLQVFSPWSSQRCPALILGSSRTPWSGHSSPGQKAAPGWGCPPPARGGAGGRKGSRSCWWTASAGWTQTKHHPATSPCLSGGWAGKSLHSSSRPGWSSQTLKSSLEGQWSLVSDVGWFLQKGKQRLCAQNTSPPPLPQNVWRCTERQRQACGRGVWSPSFACLPKISP